MSHSCSHHHTFLPTASPSFHRSFALAIILNSLFVIAEITAGLMANSLALLADAAHNVGDILGLGVAWLGYAVSFRKPNDAHTYGWGRASIYASVINAVTLVVSSGWILMEAYTRLENPTMPNNAIVASVAAFGILINGGTAWVLHKGQNDLNVRGAMLHMLADAGVSAGVVVTALVMATTGWLWMDPVISAVISVVILITCWPLLREGTHLALDGVPARVDAPAIRRFLEGDADVAGVHDLHIWALSTVKTALSAHITAVKGVAHHDLLRRIHKELQKNFGLTHVTIQVEDTHDHCIDQHSEPH